jgi:hypothetical protein
MIRTRIAVARPRATGGRAGSQSSPPGSDTSIQNRTVSSCRLCAVSPAYPPESDSGFVIELPEYISRVDVVAKLNTLVPYCRNTAPRAPAAPG